MSDINQKDRLTAIAQAGIDSVMPENVIRSWLSIAGDELKIGNTVYDLGRYERVHALGAGKASASMAKAALEVMGDRLHGGLVVTKYGHGLGLGGITVLEADHPVPDENSVAGAKAIMAKARELEEKDLALFLMSGGASALTVYPAEGISLEEKQETTRLLLNCGADIHEINAVRKHLSGFKGGNLAKAVCPATTATLAISDVVGNDLDVIGSGPTVPDSSTFGTCLKILGKYGMAASLPAPVLHHLQQGAAGLAPETLKPDDPCFENVENTIVADNFRALERAAWKAQDLGYEPYIVYREMTGEARKVAEDLVERAVGLCRERPAGKVKKCLLAGGETTVTIHGNGKGGRNQELALAAAIAISKHPEFKERMALASVGTDGTDGPTDAAGGFALPGTIDRAKGQGLDAQAFLDNNDAYNLLKQTGDLLITGPTRTNVMDIVAVLVD